MYVTGRRDSQWDRYQYYTAKLTANALLALLYDLPSLPASNAPLWHCHWVLRSGSVAVCCSLKYPSSSQLSPPLAAAPSQAATWPAVAAWLREKSPSVLEAAT